MVDAAMAFLNERVMTLPFFLGFCIWLVGAALENRDGKRRRAEQRRRAYPESSGNGLPGRGALGLLGVTLTLAGMVLMVLAMTLPDSTERIVSRVAYWGASLLGF